MYDNDSSEPIEVEYCFPVNEISCFVSFEAAFGTKTVKGIVKDKKIAQSEYEENVQRGNTAVYAATEISQPDLMKIKIGQLPPKAPIQIRLVYAEELSVSMNKFWVYKIPSDVTPRDGSGKPGSEPGSRSSSNGRSSRSNSRSSRSSRSSNSRSKSRSKRRPGKKSHSRSNPKTGLKNSSERTKKQDHRMTCRRG